MKLIVASNNAGKIAEIKEILHPFFDNILSLREAGIELDPEETGSTFFENALIKAREGFLAANCAVLSDDSGLIVDALSGAPGVLSARYSGTNSDRENNALLLKNMMGVQNRSARFFCCAVLMLAIDDYIVGEGAAEGEILFAEQGENGFGYDPLFFSNELNTSFANATAAQKNAVSHRKKALCQILQRLIEREKAG